MFAKLGALALYASAVSAMTIGLSVDVDVKVGADIALDLIAAVGDPTHVGILLKGPDVDIQLLDSAEVDAGIHVTIPDHIAPTEGYVFAAIEVGTADPHTVVYAETEAFAIVGA